MSEEPRTEGARSRTESPDSAPTREEVSRKPWKYVGYKDFARYLSSDDGLVTLRIFDRTHCRLLLRLQDQVVELEGELDVLDGRLSERAAADIDNGSVRNDTEERRTLLDKLQRKLCEYDELLTHYTTLKAQSPALNRTIQNVQTWLSTNNGSIHPLETEFIKAPDLISPYPGPAPHIHATPAPPKTPEPDPTPDSKSASKPTSRPLSAALQAFLLRKKNEHSNHGLESLVIFTTATAMLIAPLWVLATVAEDPAHRLGTVTGFLVLFLGILTWGTLARPFEILAATAGYSAVLVVFLQVGLTVRAGSGEESYSYYGL